MIINPSSPLFNDKGHDIITLRPPLAVECIGLDADQQKIFSSFIKSTRYGAAPFFLHQVDDSSIIVANGVAFYKNKQAVRQTIYGPPEKEISVHLQNENYMMNEWWAQVCSIPHWRNINLNNVKIVLPWHKYCRVYTHFLVEALHTVQCFTKLVERKWEYVIILPNDISDFHLNSFLLAGLDLASTIFLPENIIVTGKICLPSSLYTGTWYHPSIANIRGIYEPIFSDHQYDKIYVSRRDASARRMDNELELEKKLENMGFKIVVLSELPIDEQYKLFSNARFIIGSHGSGLANVIFSRPGATVVEIACIGFKNRWPMLDGSFWRIADAAGHKYAQIVFGNNKESDNWRVDVDSIIDFIKPII